MKHNKLYSCDAVKKFEFGNVRKNIFENERLIFTQNTQNQRELPDKYL